MPRPCLLLLVFIGLAGCVVQPADYVGKACDSEHRCFDGRVCGPAGICIEPLQFLDASTPDASTGCPSGTANCPVIPPPRPDAGLSCLNVTTDHDNCGRCGHVCRTEEVCRAAVCAFSLTVDSSDSDRTNVGITSSVPGIDMSSPNVEIGYFPGGTQLTLRVGDDRSADFAGACIINDAKACSFTLTGNSTVTVRVR